MSDNRDLDDGLMKESHEYCVHVGSNTIYLESDAGDNEVDQVMASRFRKNLHILLDAIANTDGPHEPITVEINTPGGCVVSGMSIFDTVRRCKHPLVALVTGEACSMGCAILQAFKDRVLEANAFVMYHGGTTSMSKPTMEFPNAAMAEIAAGQRVDDLVYARVLEKQPNLTRQEFDNAVMRGLYFYNPQDAIDYGLADRIA